MGNFARVWFRINTVAYNFNLLIFFLPVHLRPDAIAGRVCENLQVLFQSLAFSFGNVGTGG
jgi:hypothetical protein